MRIGIDVRSLLTPYQTGVGQFTRGLLSALVEYTDHQYFFYYNAARHAAPTELSEYDTVVTTKYPSKLLTTISGITNWPRIDSVMQRQTGETIDLLYSPHTQFAAHKGSTPHILTIPDLSFEHFPEYYAAKQRLWHRLHRVRAQANTATAIVVPSESTKDDVVSTFGISEDRVHVVYPGIPQTAFRSITIEDMAEVRKKYTLPSRFFFFLGTLEPRKNIDTLIEAFVASNLGPEEGFKLIIAGAPGWNNRSLMQQIEDTQSVRYIGYVTEAEKAVLYHMATACVYPSIFEGFGFPVLEAMAQGTVVITSSRTSLPEVTKGKAIYVHPYRVDEMADALCLVKGGKKMETFPEIARSYTWENAAKILSRVFETYGNK